MPELRRDPVSQRWIIIASDRGKGPNSFVQVSNFEPPAFDPFAAGNEDKTPPEIAAYRARGSQPNRTGWSVRVVPNKYPALRVEGDLQKRGDGIYDSMRGVGAHEIIIETPRTVPSLTDLTEANIQEVLWMYRERLLDLRRDLRLKYGLVFKNAGKAAGATLYHTHSQLIATPVIPDNVAWKMRSGQDYFRFRDRCLFCDMARQELAQKVRLVQTGEQFLSFAPYAARFPFETWILPLEHASHFESLSNTQVEELARLLKEALSKLERGLNRPAYNFMLFTGPFQEPANEYFHWHLEIIPRLAPVAGFEWGTGFYINPVPPEDAAEFLRNLG